MTTKKLGTYTLRPGGIQGNERLTSTTIDIGGTPVDNFDFTVNDLTDYIINLIAFPDHDELNNVNLTGATIEYGHVSNLTGSFYGQKTFENDVIFKGNVTFVQSGSVNLVNELQVIDNFVYIRQNATLGLGIGEYSGLQFRNYDGLDTDLQLVVDGDGYLLIGEVGDLQPIATRIATPDANAIAYWDDVLKTFSTVELIAIDSVNSRLGVGTNVPSSTLTVSGSVSGSGIANFIGFDNYGGPYDYSEIHIGKTIGAGTAAKFGYATQASAANSGVYINNFGDDVLYDSIFIRKGGDVGIGTPLPIGKFHVKNDIPVIYFQSDDGEITTINFGGVTNPDFGRISYSDLDGTLWFSTNGEERLRININGNIGVGTVSPQNILDLGAANLGRSLVWTDSAAIGTEHTTADLILMSGLKLSGSTNEIQYALTDTVAASLIRLDLSTGEVSISNTTSSAKTSGDVFTENKAYVFGVDNVLKLKTNVTDSTHGISLLNSSNVEVGGLKYYGADYVFPVSVNSLDIQSNVKTSFTSTKWEFNRYDEVLLYDATWVEYNSSVILVNLNSHGISHTDYIYVEQISDGTTGFKFVDNLTNDPDYFKITQTHTNLSGTLTFTKTHSWSTQTGAVVVTSNNHKLRTGDWILVKYIRQDGGGNTETTGYKQITYISANSFSYVYNSSNTTGNLVYESAYVNLITITDDGSIGSGTTTPTSKLHVIGITEYTDNADAITNGLTVGAFYRTGDTLKIVH